VEQEKDWQNLLSFIKPLIKPMTKRAIREVIFLTKIRPPKADLLEIESLVKCSWQQLLSNEVVQRLCADFQSRGIFLIQTSSDEFFDAIWLMKVYGCRYFLKQDAETLFYKIENERLQSNFYTVDSSEDAAVQFPLAMDKPIEQQFLRLEEVQAQSLSDQCKTNKSYIENESKDLSVAGFRSEYFLDVSLVSPVFNTPIPYLIDLFQSLEVSTIQPKEWILINDGSTTEYLGELEKFVLKRSTCHLPIRLVSQKNGGLAAARNLGLAVSTTQFTYFLDSDDALLSHTLSDALVAMWVDPRYVAVAGLLVYFSEKQALLDDVTIHHINSYWPSVGIPDNRVLGLMENEYISATGLFNTQLMRNSGGWDASDKTTWEDWALYNKLAWSGAEFGLIPNVGQLYRNTPGSMAKTYNPYFGRRRLVRNMPGINKFDAHILYALINQQMTKAEHQKILDLIYSSRSWRITKPFRIVLKLLRLDFSAAWAIYKDKNK
jgi:glycosyltransferase involved in cell wall biosynthesis